MSKKQVSMPRQYVNERQPLLPLSETFRELNRRDIARETKQPEQLNLIPSPQLKLF